MTTKKDEVREAYFEKLSGFNKWPMSYDMDGNEISLDEFGKLFEDPDYRCISQTVKDGYMISTIFLGINHNFTRIGLPIIFETMIFKLHGDDISKNVYMNRYSTKQEALAGHNKIVENLKEYI